MVYRAIGLMSGSSLDGLDVVFTELHEQSGKWSFSIEAAECLEYSEEWKKRLQEATTLNALDYQHLHVDYGHYLGKQVNLFIEKHKLQFKTSLISSHGHTTFHVPARKMTAQLGDGAAIAAETGLPVVSDLRALDVAFGGQGAPIVPIGEKLLLSEYEMLLNLGGIANISFNTSGEYIAFDICPANRVLNLIANELGKEYDAGGAIASTGSIHEELLNNLNELDYYKLPYPKSLANNFGTDEVYPFIKNYNLNHNDALRTCVAHIVHQVKTSIENYRNSKNTNNHNQLKLLVTGGGAFNEFLISELQAQLSSFNIEVVVPDSQLVQYKEALIMALIGVLRWREENNVLSSVTGSSRDSVGGALWMGQES
jgi:anhydro-N-acetylmuramic acid kinase